MLRIGLYDCRPIFDARYITTDQTLSEAASDIRACRRMAWLLIEYKDETGARSSHENLI